MSVYTPVEHAALETFLSHYACGHLIDYRGISAGIENTNYFVTATGGEFVLTLFEQHEPDELPYFLELMAFCADHGLPSARPLADEHGHYLRTLHGRPAALVQRLDGASLDHPDADHCRVIGTALGRLHRAGRDFPHHRPNDRGPAWWRRTAERLLPRLPAEDATVLEEELRFQATVDWRALPQGVVHADLFRDNALFRDHTLTGLIDFYYACHDAWLLDLAITANDWCSGDGGELDRPRLEALLDGYRAERPLEAPEVRAWPAMLRAAALRFWLSRLQDQHFPRDGHLTHVKDPDAFRRILLARREEAPSVPVGRAL